jgi:biopolymer transport protein ExbB
MTEFILKGGFFMWPILLCSVIGLSVTLERLYYFKRSSPGLKNFMTRVKKMILDGKTKEAECLAGSLSGPVARIVGITIHISSHNLPAEEKEKMIAQAGSNEMRKLEKNLRTLGIISHVAPLLGLLGTVTGMISAFMKIQELGGLVDASVLAGGIWEALITTAAGLAVAIPTMVVYHYFEGQADDIYAQMKNAVQSLSRILGFSVNKAGTLRNEVREDIEYGI